MGGDRSEGVSQRHRSLLALAALLALALAAVIAFVGLAHGQRELPANAASDPTTPPAPAPQTPPQTPAQAKSLPPTRLTRLPPTVARDGTSALIVRLSAPPASGSPMPMLSPSVAGSWSTEGEEEVFTPASTLEPCSSYTLTIWAQTTSVGHSRLGKRRTVPMQIDCPSTTGLQQALARLGYLGGTFHSVYGIRIPGGPQTRALAARRAFRPPRGKLRPDPTDAPPVQTGRLDAVTKGALTVFQHARGLPETGEPNRATWASLLASETADSRNPHPYTWVSVSESLPETLEVHVGHHVALTTPANTGVPGAETETGTFGIYERLVSTTMTGTDPDGTKYVAPDVPWVNYFNGGDAVHGYPRASYGSPQSNGCVELPIETAEKVYGMLQLGDVVNVTG